MTAHAMKSPPVSGTAHATKRMGDPPAGLYGHSTRSRTFL